MKRVLIFFLLYFMITGCQPHKPYRFVIVGVDLYNEDNSGTAPVEVTTGDIPAKAYAMRLEFTDVLLNPDEYHNDESYYSLQNPVKSFNVTSLSDFDNSHPAGSSLNSYFLYGAHSYKVSFQDSIRYHITQTSMGRGSFSYRNKPPANTWKINDYLLLMQPPAYFGTRSFVINMALKDNTSLTDTITVNLLP
jgi:hypothetical protein